MKKLMIVLCILFLSGSAYANNTGFDNQFSGNYGNFLVSYDQATGKIKLADSYVRKVYTANARTAQEFPLDIEFLQFSRSPLLQQYTDYLLSATVSALANSNGSIDFVIKAKANFDGGSEPQAVLVFSATSHTAKYTYTDYWGMTHEVKAIESDLRFERVETLQGDTPGSASVYKLLLSFIAKLWPANGFHSTIANWY